MESRCSSALSSRTSNLSSSSISMSIVQPLPNIGSNISARNSLKMNIDIYQEIIPENSENISFSELSSARRFRMTELVTHGRIKNKCSEIEKLIEGVKYLEHYMVVSEHNIYRIYQNQIRLIKRYNRKIAQTDITLLPVIDKDK